MFLRQITSIPLLFWGVGASEPFYFTGVKLIVFMGFGATLMGNLNFLSSKTFVLLTFGKSGVSLNFATDYLLLDICIFGSGIFTGGCLGFACFFSKDGALLLLISSFSCAFLSFKGTSLILAFSTRFLVCDFDLLGGFLRRELCYRF